MHTTPPHAKEYAEVFDRCKALFTDSLMLVLLMYAGSQGFNEMAEVPVGAQQSAALFIFVLYEPLMVAGIGGTVGHLVMRLRVRDVEDEERNIPLYRAFLRYGVKVLLGTFSLVTITGEEKSQALHDKVADSVMVKV